jgi:GWxTD domain-containing protein
MHYAWGDATNRHSRMDNSPGFAWSEAALLMKIDASRFSLLLCALLIFCVSATCWAKPKTVVPPQYAHWLNEDVNYLITDNEKKAFLELKTDDARDKFIESFWRIRNPDPNAPTNEAKQEHYERLAYADAHFGYGNVEDGWQSDRGMVYITLGAPKQIEKYPATQELKPLQIWFYENLSGALPVHFYLLFYKPSAAEDYQLYSPYQDRPQALIDSTNAINNDPIAIKIIRDDIDDEAAHIALSLIPGEPVDMNNPSPSLQSDVLLNNIRNYRNLPMVREMLEARNLNGEDVTHRVVLGEQFSDLSVMATRDPGRQASIRYLFRLLHPEDFSISRQADGRYYYSLRLQARLTDIAGKVISDTVQPMTDYVPSSAFDKVKTKCFGVEGRIAVPPGRYQLSLALTNLATKEVYRQTRSVLVPGGEDRIGLSQVVFADPNTAQRSSSALDPFSFEGVDLRPIGSDSAVIAQGAPLRAIFQIWMPPGSPVALHGESLDVHYLIGQLNSPIRTEVDQQVDRGSFSPDGNLLMGRDFRTDTLTPGFYRLVIRVTDPSDAATAFQSLNFQVRDDQHPVAALWTIDVPEHTP